MLRADDRLGIEVAVCVFVFSVLLKAHDLDAISVSCEFLAVRHMDIGNPTTRMEARICTFISVACCWAIVECLLLFVFDFEAMCHGRHKNRYFCRVAAFERLGDNPILELGIM